ncbi:MAG: hypothetical protein GY927_14800 [bacterium]|nr:hypothetical protein [bacterium]
MSSQITTAFVNQYRDNVYHLLRQNGSLLRGCVRTETQKGEKDFYEFIGDAVVYEKTSRHMDVQYSDTPHSRRMVVTKSKKTAELIDREDKLRMIVDPTSDYARAQADALGRDLDRTIWTALFGNAYSGKDGTTAVAASSDMTVAVTLQDGGGSSDCSLNIAKLRRAKRLLDSKYVPKTDRKIGCPPRQMEHLLSSTEITSSDYNTVKALVQGDVNTFMGFEFVESQLLEDEFTDANDDDRCPFWHKPGMLLAIAEDIKTEMDRIPTKHNAMQVLSSLDAGATRLEEFRVGHIICDPTAGITAA